MAKSKIKGFKEPNINKKQFRHGAYKRNQAVPKGYDYTPHMSAIHKHVQATGNVTEGIRKGSLETKFKGNPATIKKYYYKWEKENRKNNK